MAHEYIERVTCDICGTERTYVEDRRALRFHQSQRARRARSSSATRPLKLLA